MRKSKRFINGDIINWYDETSKCWRLGLFWKEDAYSYSNDRVIIYFPETLKNDYITLSLDTTLFPSTDTTLVWEGKLMRFNEMNRNNPIQ